MLLVKCSLDNVFYKERCTHDEADGTSRERHREIEGQHVSVNDIELLLKLHYLDKVDLWVKLDLLKYKNQVLQVNCRGQEVKWHEQQETDHSQHNVNACGDDQLPLDLVPNIRDHEDVHHLNWVNEG